MTDRKLFLTAGISYIVIFVCAIFANFFVLEGILAAPVKMVTDNSLLVSLGIIAFLIAVVFDVVVAWALRELYKGNRLTTLSTYFRIMHAAIFAVAIFALVETLRVDNADGILALVENFNDIWLIGLFFFGIHLLLLPKIIRLPRFIAWMLPLAGLMYMIDTMAHFLLMNYQDYADLFLMLVAVPSILGEMAFGIWLLFQREV